MRPTALVCTLLSLGLVIAVRHSSAVEPPKEITNSIGMKLVLIPAGEFMMGSSESPEELAKAFPGTAPGWFQDEFPQHKVRITKPFYLGVTEVTQDQYERVMRKNPSTFSKTGGGADQVKEIDTSNFPVELVTWDDAVEFCKRLSTKEGQTYRLPTEAEWEYVCRAGSTTRYFFGDDPTKLAEYAWFWDKGDKSKWQTHPVGRKKPNSWGLYDMHGNVWEWCGDWYGEDFYAKSPTDDPAGPTTGSVRVYRGGGWNLAASSCRSASRYGYRPD